MSYFSILLLKLKSKLPLIIEEVSWDGNTFYMGHSNWTFNSFSDWVITNDKVLLKGCHDTDTEVFLLQLKGLKIIEVKQTLDLPSYDPVFYLNNNYRIRIFSTLIVDPWTFTIENENIFIASPSDENWNINKK